MSDAMYYNLAKVLDTLPNGFPSTESGVEIKLLKKVFEPEEAELFCKLRLTYETADQIAERWGTPLKGLTARLETMWKKGQIDSRISGGTRVFRMMPWVIGIYEFQLNRMDKEFAALYDEYRPFFGPQLVMTKPQVMQVIPIERNISANYEALPYERVSSIIEGAKSFAVNDCICRKKSRLLGKGCDRPLEICMAIGDEPNLWDNHPWGARVISKEEAYGLLRKAEEAALVHMTSNVQSGQWFICNCCGCCDPFLLATRAGLRGVINSHFYSVIDPEQCNGCGICKDERCQVDAIVEAEGSYSVDRDKCIGCGLCVSTCSTEAIRLVHKSIEELAPPPKNEMEWYENRASQRGVDFSAFK